MSETEKLVEKFYSILKKNVPVDMIDDKRKLIEYYPKTSFINAIFSVLQP